MHPTPVEATSLGAGYPDMANQDYLQVMSPNLDGSSSATTVSRTIAAHRQDLDNAPVIPVPNGSIEDGSSYSAPQQGALVPNFLGSADQRSAIKDPQDLAIEHRNVRRKTSPTSIVPSARQPDIPQRAVLRTEFAGKDESIAVLRQQLAGVQNLARTELQAQRNTFGTMATIYENRAREVNRREVQDATDDLSQNHAAEIAQ